MTVEIFGTCNLFQFGQLDEFITKGCPEQFDYIDIIGCQIHFIILFDNLSGSFDQLHRIILVISIPDMDPHQIAKIDIFGPLGNPTHDLLVDPIIRHIGRLAVNVVGRPQNQIIRIQRSSKFVGFHQICGVFDDHDVVGENRIEEFGQDFAKCSHF